MRFLFTTIQFAETAAYTRVGEELQRRGHDVTHVVLSRQAARDLASHHRVHLLPDRMREVASVDIEREAARIEARYPITSLRSVFLSDPEPRGRVERDLVERTVRYFLALETIFDAERPDVLVPEVGSETMRTVAHLIALDRGVTSLFLFHTIFPNPLRLYVDTPHAPIVDKAELRALTKTERVEVEDFIQSYIQSNRPTLGHRRSAITLAKLRDFARHIAVRMKVDRDNEYLRPSRFVLNYLTRRSRARLARRLYGEVPEAAFVYFPMHVTEDFKVKRVIPHCVDQAYIVEMLADMVPQGVQVVLKEHPVSIGRNPYTFLRRLTRRPNVYLVDPHTSSHRLIERAQAVAVISSTVGLEALLHGKPVLTLGQPFYSGYDVTVDVDSFRELPLAIDTVLRFQPDRDRVLRLLHAAMRSTFPGAPASVDGSAENIRLLAESIEKCGREARDALELAHTGG